MDANKMIFAKLQGDLGFKRRQTQQHNKTVATVCL